MQRFVSSALHTRPAVTCRALPSRSATSLPRSAISSLRNRTRARRTHSSPAQWTKTRAVAATGASDGRRRARGALQKRRLTPTSPTACRENAARIRILTHGRAVAAREGRDDCALLGAPRNRRNAAATPPTHTWRAARNHVKTTQVAALEAKWQEPRWKGVERPYSAQDVVAMRGTLQGEAPYQDATAQKLFETLDLCANTGGHSRTYGALDPVQAATMAPKLTSIYVSGWQCSSTSSSSNEPGPDFADYPYDTVPKKVDQLFKALKHHDRRAFSSGQDVDYLTPIVADGDTGHGGLTAVMKLTQLMVEAGAAGVHFEDQSVCRVVHLRFVATASAWRAREATTPSTQPFAPRRSPGTKKCGHMGGKVLVPMREHADRLNAARLQCDVIARTDAGPRPSSRRRSTPGTTPSSSARPAARCTFDEHVARSPGPAAPPARPESVRATEDVPEKERRPPDADRAHWDLVTKGKNLSR